MKRRVGSLSSFVLLLMIFVLKSAAETPRLASSYKSVINIRDLFPGDKMCPSGWVALGDSGDGIDSFGTNITLTEQLCAQSSTGAFFGEFNIKHSSADAYRGVFNGTFVPSGEVLEVHATWRITHGTGRFSGITGAGTGKGVSGVVNGTLAGGPVLLDGQCDTSVKQPFRVRSGTTGCSRQLRSHLVFTSPSCSNP